ncbi:hypothetical protein SNL152K_6040 [Streptomyces sp. NL15-2K]|nr:hypothetical protein SNL152K_6040 [Streptomyces sp. NL15-2K]
MSRSVPVPSATGSVKLPSHAPNSGVAFHIAYTHHRKVIRHIRLAPQSAR